MAGYLQENNFMIPHKSVGKMLNLHQFLSLILLSSSFSVSSDTHSIGKVLLVSHYQYHAITEILLSKSSRVRLLYNGLEEVHDVPYMASLPN